MTEIKAPTRTKVYAVVNHWGDSKQDRNIVFVTKHKEQAQLYKDEYKKLYTLVGEINSKFGTDLEFAYGSEIEIEETYAI